MNRPTEFQPMAMKAGVTAHGYYGGPDSSAFNGVTFDGRDNNGNAFKLTVSAERLRALLAACEAVDERTTLGAGIVGLAD